MRSSKLFLRFFLYMVKFSKYDIFHKKCFLGGIFYFLDYFRYWYIDKPNDGFEAHIMYFNLKKES